MRGLNLDHVNAFTEVVRLGSFSAAASHLNLTQPAISQQNGQLEKRLGVRLLERLGRRAMPTAAGNELLDHAARIDSAVASLLEGLARFTSGEVGRVRLGTGATAAIFRLPPLLRSLRHRLPDLEITIATGNTSDIVKGVQDNALDIGLVTLPANGRGLEVTPLLDDEFVAVTARDGVALPRRVTPAVMARLPVIMFEPGGHTRVSPISGSSRAASSSSQRWRLAASKRSSGWWRRGWAARSCRRSRCARPAIASTSWCGRFRRVSTVSLRS
ncbi:MAG: LysR family transcriptional regulator [Reyranella sp.]|nr:LysR family transcriptional regulator [Reyranella sp.]